MFHENKVLYFEIKSLLIGIIVGPAIAVAIIAFQVIGGWLLN